MPNTNTALDLLVQMMEDDGDEGRYSSSIDTGPPLPPPPSFTFSTTSSTFREWLESAPTPSQPDIATAMTLQEWLDEEAQASVVNSPPGNSVDRYLNDEWDYVFPSFNPSDSIFSDGLNEIFANCDIPLDAPTIPDDGLDLQLLNAVEAIIPQNSSGKRTLSSQQVSPSKRQKN